MSIKEKSPEFYKNYSSLFHHYYKDISNHIIDNLDSLPIAIKNSSVFTGNDLGMLANVETLSATQYTADEMLHQQAQLLLKTKQVEAAWQLLSVH